MKLVIFCQIFVGFISVALASPLALHDSIVSFKIRDDLKLSCSPADLNICTIEVIVFTSSNVFNIEIYDQNCHSMCSQNFTTFDTRLSWSPDCLGGKPMAIQVDGNRELHPIIYNFNQINIGIVPDGNKDVVTHREVFACPTTSVAAATTSSAPASTAVIR